MVWRSRVLGTLVVGNILCHRLEVLQLLKVQKLQNFGVGNIVKLAKNHVPSVVEPLQVVAMQGQRLEVIHVIQHLAICSGRVVTETPWPATHARE